MSRRFIILLVLVVLPGISFTAISGYYLLPEWVALDGSVKNYQRLAKQPTASDRDLGVAAVAEQRHRLNCFAEGMGVLLGWMIFSIGVHGLCTLPRKATPILTNPYP